VALPLQQPGIATAAAPKNKLITYKKDVPVYEFLKLKKVKRILKQPLQIVLGHCRQPTKGEPKFDFNNHPFVDDNLVLIHQGIIWNDEVLRKAYKLPEKGETDSWVIVQLIKHFLQKEKTLIRAIAMTHQLLRGNWACALMDKNEPDAIYLFCHEKSIITYYLPKKNIFIFSTEKSELNNAILNAKQHFNIFTEIELPRIAEYEVKDDHCLVLNGKPILYKLPKPPAYRYFPTIPNMNWGENNYQEDYDPKKWNFKKNKNKNKHKGRNNR